MALWSNTDEDTSAPKYAVAGGYGVSANGQVLYGNTTQDVFVTGKALGVFGVSADETVGTGNVGTLTIVSSGSGFTARPTLTITGANTTPATAVANAAVVGVTITAPGTGYEVGNTFTATGGTGTSAVLTVDDVDVNGNVTSITITTAGDYTVVPTVTDNPFTSNTGSGIGFTANLSLGVGSTQITNAGEGYNQSTVGVTVGGAGGTGAVVTATLTGQEGTNRGLHAGWNLRKEGSGGRAGRVHYETLVAMGSMTGDGDDDAQLAE
jgi:hypothetical protein